MKKLTGNRTSFIIAHRLSTIRDADRIVVMENGALIETGTHASLLQAHGLYARMFLAGQARQALPPAATSPCGSPTGPGTCRSARATGAVHSHSIVAGGLPLIS